MNHHFRFHLSERRASEAKRAAAPVGRLLALLVLLATAMSNGASAQSSDGQAAADPWAGVEQMLVVGGSTAGILQDTAVSVTAFDANELEALGVGDVSDIGQFTPNLEIRTSGSTTPILFIRGVGLNDFTANASGSVAVYQDEVALNLPAFQSAQLFDTENLQVLKGPQGSGPGRNASAGAIKVFSRRPSGDYGASFTGGVGNYGLFEVEGAVEAPIIPDLLAVRVAFKVERRDGLVTNRCGGFSQGEVDAAQAANQALCGEVGGVIGEIVPGIKDELNDTDRWAARGILRYQPDWLDSDWLFNIHGSRVDQLATVGQPIGTTGNEFSSVTKAGYRIPEIVQERRELLDAAFTAFGIPPGITQRRCDRRPGCPEARAQATESAFETLANRLAYNRPLDREPWEGDYNLDGHERQEIWGASLRGEMEIGPLSFSTITGFEHYDRSRILDADYTSSRVFEFYIEDDAWQVTQDLRLEQELEAVPVTWKAGGYALAERLDYDQLTDGDGDIPGLFQAYTQETWAFGVYGEVEWAFTDDFELKVGARYNWERKYFDITEIVSPVTASSGNAINACTGNENRAAADCDDRTTFSDPTWVVRLTYHLDEATQIYAKYTRGWKGAQYNASDGANRGAFTLAQPETIDAIELGFGGNWLDGRLSVNGAFFFYDYKNYQVFLFSNDLNNPPVREVRNASTAQLYGAEADMRIEPIERLVGMLRFGWLESKFLDFSDSAFRSISIPSEINPRVEIVEVPIDYTGNRLPNTPRFKVSGSIEYTILMGRAGSITPRYDFSFTDDFAFDPSKNGRGAPNNRGVFFLPKHAIGQRAYTLHNARLTYRTLDETIEASFWVRNLTDLTYKTLAFDASETGGLVANLVGDPRTYGASVKFTF